MTIIIDGNVYTGTKCLIMADKKPLSTVMEDYSGVFYTATLPIHTVINASEKLTISTEWDMKGVNKNEHVKANETNQDLLTRELDGE